MAAKSIFVPRILAEGGVVLGLATALSLIKLFAAPFGGSVTPGSMVPIILLAMIRGPVVGTTVGVVYGFLQFILGPWFLTPLQFLLDYPFAFGALGLAGFFWRPAMTKNTSWTGRYFFSIIAVFFAIGGRFLSHFFAGVFFWGHYAPEGQSVWLYSLVYNGGYLGVEFLISAALTWFLTPSLGRLIKP
ncbi:MAG TPA: energy-coupled thiamine transporter ThiT [Atribacteraceae bacterium]|nr:energy-coupled thiamine transporter ThiT [Atribacteraceae bacterium]